MLDHGASPIDVMKMGHTKSGYSKPSDEHSALMHATIADNLRLMELLISGGADVNYADKAHKRALDIAWDRGNIASINLDQRFHAVSSLRSSLDSATYGPRSPRIDQGFREDMTERSQEPEREAAKVNGAS